jgi:hypothetical protein
MKNTKEPAKPVPGTKCARCNRNATIFKIDGKTAVCRTHLKG